MAIQRRLQLGIHFPSAAERIRMPPAPNGLRLAENFIELVGPRLRDILP